MNFNVVTEFEKKIAEFFGAPYAIAVDSCTHGIELALRYTDAKLISVPRNTYLSIPFLAQKLNIELCWKDENWVDYYYLAPSIIDAAVLWKPKSYISHTFMGISFQYQKHLSLGRGGILLVDNSHAAEQIKKMSYDRFDDENSPFKIRRRTVEQQREVRAPEQKLLIEIAKLQKQNIKRYKRQKNI